MVEHDFCDVCQVGPLDVLLVAGVAAGSMLNVCAECAELPELHPALARSSRAVSEPPVTLESVLGDFEAV
jgi:hypothetical protein